MKIRRLTLKTIFAAYFYIFFIYLLLTIWCPDLTSISSKGDDGEYLNPAMLESYQQIFPNVIITKITSLFSEDLQVLHLCGFIAQLLTLALFIILLSKHLSNFSKNSLSVSAIIIIWLLSNPSIPFIIIYNMRDIYLAVLILVIVHNKEKLSKILFFSYAFYIRPTVILPIIMIVGKLRYLFLIFIATVPFTDLILKFLLMPAGVYAGHIDFKLMNFIDLRMQKLYESGIASTGNLTFDFLIVIFKSLVRPLNPTELELIHYGRDGYRDIYLQYQSLDPTILFANISIIPNLIILILLLRSVLFYFKRLSYRHTLYIYIALMGIYGVFAFSERQTIMFCWLELELIFGGIKNDDADMR